VDGTKRDEYEEATMLQHVFEETVAWFASLSPEFAFLLALPFLIAIAAFVADGVRRRYGRSSRSARMPGRWMAANFFKK
jgi:hypothetical protein